ncbi:hypothetical protein AMTR_s00053p00198470 [Amborella trichopoda]|uniref:Uncharacterized protein n=1 Tax=Amborella trichopoda TaxID=13333 RepID=W1P5J0_AMBTC|nr:hypothetical protein AMTR_s00053p00198470 [Amborella trichopoda]
MVDEVEEAPGRCGLVDLSGRNSMRGGEINSWNRGRRAGSDCGNSTGLVRMEGEFESTRHLTLIFDSSKARSSANRS